MAANAFDQGQLRSKMSLDRLGRLRSLEATAAMIFAPVSRWVFGLARNAALDSPESVYPVCVSCPIAQAQAGRHSGPFPFPLVHKRNARDVPDTQTWR